MNLGNARRRSKQRMYEKGVLSGSEVPQSDISFHKRILQELITMEKQARLLRQHFEGMSYAEEGLDTVRGGGVVREREKSTSRNRDGEDLMADVLYNCR